MLFTRDQFERMLPNADPDIWYDLAIDILPRYSIDTPRRMAAFLANVAHESAQFTAMTENLNYSAPALRRTWPARFPTDEIANAHARNPRKIANKAYGGRMGNGPEHTDEGWKYRGRGLIQLTGKSNYLKASIDLFHDETLLEQPDLLTEPEYALHTACWFWDKHNLNVVADREDLEKITRTINGGLNGHKDRVEKYEHILEILNEEPFEPNNQQDV